MGSPEASPRIRPYLRRVTFSNQADQCLAVMKASYDRCITLPAENPQPGERGAGTPLPQDW